MQTQSNCLHEAMFVAAESYSHSIYDMSLLAPMAKNCADIFMPGEPFSEGLTQSSYAL